MSPTPSQRWVATIHGVASASFLAMSIGVAYMQFEADRIKESVSSGNAVTLPGVFLAFAIAFMFSGMAKAMEFADHEPVDPK